MDISKVYRKSVKERLEEKSKVYEDNLKNEYINICKEYKTYYIKYEDLDDKVVDLLLNSNLYRFEELRSMIEDNYYNVEVYDVTHLSEEKTLKEIRELHSNWFI